MARHTNQAAGERSQAGIGNGEAGSARLAETVGNRIRSARQLSRFLADGILAEARGEIATKQLTAWASAAKAIVQTAVNESVVTSHLGNDGPDCHCRD